jgi:hypothetical protein
MRGQVSPLCLRAERMGLYVWEMRHMEIEPRHAYRSAQNLGDSLSEPGVPYAAGKRKRFWSRRTISAAGTGLDM